MGKDLNGRFCACTQAEVVEGKLFETFLKLTDVGLKKSLNSLREKPDKNRWISTGTTVNAFYSAILNSVSKCPVLKTFCFIQKIKFYKNVILIFVANVILSKG